MNSETEPPPPKRKRGRPSSGVDRKEQVRRAVQKHRRSAKFGEGALLQVELPVYLLMEIKAIASRGKKKRSLRETVTRMLEEAWRADYIAQAQDERERIIHEKTADGLIAKWREEFEASFNKKPEREELRNADRGLRNEKNAPAGA